MNIISTIPTPKRHLYAVGDIHGCLNELKLLMNKLDFDSSQDQLIFLGDYIDRGPDSRGVIDYLIALKKTAPNTVFLRGNHEDMFLHWMGYEGKYGDSWYNNCARETIESYTTKMNFRDHVKKVPGHLDFFLGLDYSVQCSTFVFVHAGLNPFDSIDKQDPEDLVWIRGPFLNSVPPFSKTIVFGHTPFKEVHFSEKKIGLDTGCVFGGKLSCIECNSKTLIQVDSDFDYRQEKTLY